MTYKKLTTDTMTIISTHTLTWSVTDLTVNTVRTLDISTHTLTWSVTIGFGGCFLEAHISTHTLTWSVTGIVKM